MAAGDVCDVCPTQISQAVRTGDMEEGEGAHGVRLEHWVLIMVMGSGQGTPHSGPNQPAAKLA